MGKLVFKNQNSNRVVAYIYNFSSREAEAEEWESKDSLSYIGSARLARSCLK